MTGRIPWGRVLLEGAVIVFSILLAFAIDAWWAGVAEFKQEQLALAGLETDFSGYLVALERDRERNQERVEAARALRQLSGPDPAHIDGMTVQEFLSQVITYNSIILPAGTLSSMLQSDGLALISDLELRFKLAAWTQILETAQERNAYLYEQSRELDAFLKPQYPMAPILHNARLNVIGLPLDGGIGETSFPVDVQSLLSNQEFANHLAFAEDASLLVIQSVDQLAEQARQILLDIRNQSKAD